MTKHKERPITFDIYSVRAILAGKKTQTRRVMKPQPDIPHDKRWRYDGVDDEEGGHWIEFLSSDGEPTEKYECIADKCPFGEKGDRLWVRETFALLHNSWYSPYLPKPDYNDPIYDKGDYSNPNYCCIPQKKEPDCIIEYLATCIDENSDDYRWRPSIHMPRWASRITLETTEVRVERLRDILEDDAESEGVEPFEYDAPHGKIKDYIAGFAYFWDAFNVKCGYGWDVNPYVWVISFRRVENDNA
jgi:hypothetical protein